MPQEWPPRYALEEYHAGADEIAGLLAQAERLLADAQVEAVSVASRHALAHSAVVLLAQLALCAAGLRATESHHYWCIESLRHTVGLGDDEVAALHAHRAKRHSSTYSPRAAVSEAEFVDLLARATDRRVRLLNWLSTRRTGAG